MLADLAGKPLVVRTWENAKKIEALDSLLVAADDERIVTAIESQGGEAVLTDPELPSGSDRVLAAIRDHPAELVVNIQGDEPLLPPVAVTRAIELLQARPDLGVTTAACALSSEESKDPNVVKVVLNSSSAAMYFSRSLIPYPRYDHREVTPLGHIGFYVFRRPVLEQFCALKPSPLERTEGLEQLRLLEAGIAVGVVVINTRPIGIDTAEDLELIRTQHFKEVM